MIDIELKEFSERLNYLCDEGDIPAKGRGRQQAISKLFDVSKESARKWLEGGGFPRTKRIIEIANYFNADSNWLLSGEGQAYPNSENESPKLGRAMRKIPVLSWDTLNQLSQTESTAPKHLAIDWTFMDGDFSPSSFALIVQGNTMTSPTPPSIPAGSTIVIDPNENYKSGDLVVAVSSENESLFRKITIDGNKQYLEPLNTRYPITECPESTTILGVVKRAVLIL